ncbi:NADH-quinone oxidoreductase, E subunit [Anaeromyxobacter sp. K]|uniref:NADH dehydrogenase subunit E n=2 Tax=Anaeromyxobacter dehalogenans TaxID=161493 RepID=Q2IHB0_ANADE|nr:MULTISPECIES: NAD(P)H-dependent oxidoreductase subunit E [Anaeromyxobacter]ABC83964.1 NADH dehydrogenase subunit E [Anaeromyxobacter dehalogenans 2CP-C]ACG75535.1 NADH-quinone oxidoreductase, E subunit [Anaeromyxobacter sp. K]ACL67672.1 NADH-quinone oxidoreductase, E subunit [Anaeromyxobacter dehalogenans 2CP-1]
MTNPASVGAVEELPREKVEHFDRELAGILNRYPPDRKAAAMIPALRLGQEIFGYLSPAVQRLAAERLGTSPARAEEVATFYVMFHTEPPARHVVEVCTNVSCCLTGGERIFEHLKKKLELANGQSTRDGRITLREVECLGSCGTAPAMLVDEEMHERLTIQKVDQIVGGLK